MALLNTKIVGQYLQFPHAEHPLVVRQSMGFAPMPSKSVLRRNRITLLKVIPVVSSAQESALPVASASSSSAGKVLQAASYSAPLTSSSPPSSSAVQYAEEFIEKAIFNCRFFTLMGVVGSLTGSVLCFLKGCSFVVMSFKEYFLTCLHGVSTGKVILLLVEAVDVYLMGTVMLIFGMGLYELFISTIDVTGGNCMSGGSRTALCGSNLFGLFRLRERPKWLEIRSLDELKLSLAM
ncbi:hypothetical protein L7F22_037673 [Adiantum nelumboides]|nr:hypothetical protein [Adiantum nelumboides]